jgi:hypothetical protein
MVGITAIETSTNGIINITILIAEIIWYLITFCREIEFIPPKVDNGDHDSIVAVSAYIFISLSCHRVCIIWIFLWMYLETRAVMYA